MVCAVDLDQARLREVAREMSPGFVANGAITAAKERQARDHRTGSRAHLVAHWLRAAQAPINLVMKIVSWEKAGIAPGDLTGLHRIAAQCGDAQGGALPY